MTASNKYRVIEAATLEARKRHRFLIENALKDSNLPRELRDELEWELRQALIKENLAQTAADEESNEEERKKKDGGDDGDGGEGNQEGDTGSSDGGEDDGSAGGGGDGGGGGPSTLEIFALLLFLVERDIEQPHTDSVDTEFYDSSAKIQSSAPVSEDQSYTDKTEVTPTRPEIETKSPASSTETQADTNVSETLDADRVPLAAATLLFNRVEKAAHIHEPYMPEQADSSHPPSVFLPSLEQHAATLGARMMHLRVHPDAVDLFRKKFGYEPHGKAYRRRGTPIQRMRKTLIRHPKAQGSDCV